MRRRSFMASLVTAMIPALAGDSDEIVLQDWEIDPTIEGRLRSRLG